MQPNKKLARVIDTLYHRRKYLSRDKRKVNAAEWKVSRDEQNFSRDEQNFSSDDQSGRQEKKLPPTDKEKEA